MAKERSSQWKRQMELVGSRLKLRRKEASLSLRDIEERTGLSIATLSDIENGKQLELRATAFFSLCELLMLDPMRAWYGDERRSTGKAPTTPPPASVERRSRRPAK